MNRDWRVLASVSWALAHASHVSMATAQHSPPTSPRRHHTPHGSPWKQRRARGASALKSVGGVAGCLFLSSWTEKELLRLCRASFRCVHPRVRLSARASVQEAFFGFFIFFVSLTAASRAVAETSSVSCPLPVVKFIIFFIYFLIGFFFPLTPSTQACGVGITGLDGRLCGSVHFFMQV